MLWVVRKTVVSLLFISVISFLISLWLWTSSPDIGSSKKSIAGLCTSALAIFILCFKPFESIRVGTDLLSNISN